IVVRCGPDVRSVQPGDEVIAITTGAFASFATASVDLVTPKPRAMTFEEGASVPLAFLTAHYALHRVGRISSGERVLIHAAAGGVGLAAVQLAQQAGAEIFATAGTEEKRAFLRRQGVRHVFDSRSLDFATAVRDLTRSEGIDVVLNSLTGDAIAMSLALLRTNGRFVEIGKSEILAAQQVAAINPLPQYPAFVLAKKLAQPPAAIRPLWMELMTAFDAGRLQPSPVRVFALEDAVEAFRYMARARHIGKIVLVPRHD